MVYCFVINIILSYKIQGFLENPMAFFSSFPDYSFIDMIICYVSDNNLNQTLNLKFVIEAIVLDKTKKYLEFVLSLIFYLS